MSKLFIRIAGVLAAFGFLGQTLFGPNPISFLMLIIAATILVVVVSSSMGDEIEQEARNSRGED